MVVIVCLAAAAVYLSFMPTPSGGSPSTSSVQQTGVSTSSASSSSVTSLSTSILSTSTTSLFDSTSTTSSVSRSTLTTSGSASVSLNSTEVLVIIPPGIQDLANHVSFEPVNITVVIGVNNTIVWLNNDNEEHILESTSWPSNGQPFQFYSLPGKTNAVTFTTAGTYTYFCEWHPIWMDGTITVKA